MKALKLAIAAGAAALALATLPTPASAGGGYRGGGGGWHGGGGGHWHGGGGGHWHGSVRVGIGWPGYYYGVPVGYYGGYYGGYYDGSAYGPVYGDVNAPVTYVERGDVAPAANGTSNAGGNWWYWCEGSRSYYPYVKDCPGGWQRVAPQPPPR
jgi:hypothetical protein